MDSIEDPIHRDYAFRIVNQTHQGRFNDKEPNYKFITVSNKDDIKYRSDLYFSLVFNSCCNSSICKILNCSMFDLFNLDLHTFMKIHERVRLMDAKEDDNINNIKREIEED